MTPNLNREGDTQMALARRYKITVAYIAIAVTIDILLAVFQF